ncbi:MAG: CBS domain-containing protein [Thermoguttaceae bacterium]
MTLADILKAKGSVVYTIGRDATLDQAISRLIDHNIGSLMVCKRDVEQGECLEGIITERDILHACSSRSGYNLATTRVGEVMSTDLVTGSPSDAVETVMGLMTQRRMRHLPVLSNGRLVGLVSMGDIVKAQHDHLALENRFMKDYIHTAVK